MTIASHFYSSAELPASWVYSGLRFAGMIVVAPMVAGRFVSLRFRVAFLLVLIAPCVMSAPAWMSTTAAGDDSTLTMAPLPMAGELLLGVTLGWGALLTFSAVRSSAALAGEGIGLGSGWFVDGTGPTGNSGLTQFYSWLALFVLVAGNVHHQLLASIVESFSWVPAGSVGDGETAARLAKFALGSAAHLFEAAVVLAFPIMMVLLLSSAVQGVLARLFPFIEIVFLGFLLRFVVAFTVLILYLPTLVEWIRSLYHAALQSARTLVMAISP